MDWDAIGAIGEVLGAIGVAITLLYLAVQMRRNTRAMQAQTNEARTTHLREMNSTVMDSEWYWEVLEKLTEQLPGRTNILGGNSEATVEDWKEALATLSFAERGRFSMLALTQWHFIQNQAFQRESGFDPGVLDPESLIRAQANMYEALGISSVGNSMINEMVAAFTFHR